MTWTVPAALKRVTVPPGPRGTRTRLEREVTGPPTSTPTSHGRFSLGCVGHPIAAAAALPRPPRPHTVDNQTPVWVVGRIIDAVTRRKAAVVASGARSRQLEARAVVKNREGWGDVPDARSAEDDLDGRDAPSVGSTMLAVALVR